MTLINDLQVDDLSLLYGKPVLIKGAGFSIIPKKLKDIAILGEETYFKYLNVVTMDFPKLDSEELDNIDDKVKDYFLLTMLLNQSVEFRFLYEQALTFFLEVLVTYNEELQGLFYSLDNESILFLPEQLEAIRYVLRKQHNLEVKEDKESPQNEIAKKILEKQKAGREKVAKAKKSQDVKITFSDVVSGVTAFSSNLNILNIWNLTYYAFYNQFHRLKMVEDYDVGLKSIMAGADSKKITLKHWIEPIQTKQE